MPAWLDAQALTTVLTATALIALFRWGRNIDKTMSAHTKVAELLVQRLNDHITSDEDRHEALEDRLKRAEDDLRWNGFRRP